MEVAQIWNNFQGELKGFINKRVQNESDSDDILQDVFVKIICNHEKISEAKNIKQYLYGMVRNGVFDYFRKHQRQPELELKTDVFTEEESEDLYTTLAICCVAPFIEKLPPIYKSVINEVELKGLSQKDLAKNLDISYSAVKSRVQRGREKLRDLILGCCNDEMASVHSLEKIDCCE
ncbi:MAG: sigma-70 family RNA polymerase sigma factor [Reichenbachiella sp.]